MNTPQQPDPRLELERIVLTLLEQKGPMDFARLYACVMVHIMIMPAELHDHLNNWIQSGRIKLYAIGKYDRG